MIRVIIIFIIFISAPWIGDYLKPDKKLVVQGFDSNLSSLIPEQFATWKAFENKIEPVRTTKQQQVLGEIYTELVERTYINESGEQVMLSIAYGNRQESELSVHFPEVCYPAQGFDVTENSNDVLIYQRLSIPVTRLETQYKNFRYEPVTYWIRNGDYLIQSATQSRLVELKYGLTGHIPDGLLFRVSSIGKNSKKEFEAHNLFIRDLLNNLTDSDMRVLLGSKVMSKK